MFEESMLESAHLIRTQSRWPAVISFAIQATIVAIVVAIPVFHPEVVKLPGKLSELTAPIMPKPVEIPRVHPQTVSTATSAPAFAEAAPATHAPVSGTRFDPNVHTDAPPVIGQIQSMTAGDPRGNSNISGLSNDTSSPNVVVKPAAPKGPTRISTGVSAGLLLAPIQPIYPAIARAAHQEGTVTIHAIISKEGHIESATVVGGPQLLAQAALEAVRNARYRPYLLNGIPTEVDTTFQINFRLGQ